jgi:transcription elongation GreA/GreB family factor/very-short-patch-repair endonuclease
MKEDQNIEVLDSIDEGSSISCPFCGQENKIDSSEKLSTVCRNCNQLLVQQLPDLERLRRRLLDLTNRNRLLNFRHPKRSSLRAVDELPDFLYEQLLDDKILTYIPVPEPSDEEIEESGFEERPTPAEWGAKLGLNTSYEMPESYPMSDQVPEKHVDQFIQTLLYPSDLEAVLRRIRSLSQTAIEESGTNMLYLAFGFLEWSDSDDSSVKRMAPLMLLPVILEKNRKASEHGTYYYSISYSGESISANLSFKEKLQLDMGLELPEIDDDELPESYFKKIEKIIAQKPNWKIRRHLTLSLFHFGKLLMYLDLDPDKWPDGARISSHPIVKKFFEGIKDSEIEEKEEYNIDEYDKTFDEVPLIEDADSSQHSALIDAIKGRSLVIEGPPGTGKSQTITNLIGAAINNGKTVLFVSEKLAALEVVRRKLDSTGLGIFCLELHSHKTQKRRLLDDVEERYQKKGSFLHPAKLNEQIQLLERTKKQLKTYIKLINQKVLDTGQTIQQVLCAATRYRKELKGDPHVFLSIPLNNLDILTSLYFRQSEESLERYLQAYMQVQTNEQNIVDHPWYGINNADLMVYERDHIVKLLENWLQRCVELREEVSKITSLLEVDIPCNLNEAERIINFTKALPKRQGTELFELFPFLVNDENITLLENFVVRINNSKSTQNQLQSFFTKSSQFNNELATLWESKAAVLKSLTKNKTTLAELDSFILDFNKCSNLLPSLELDIMAVLTTFGLEEKLSAETLSNLIICLNLCLEVPLRLAGNRNSLFDGDEFDDLLAGIESRKINLNERQNHLTNYFDFSILPPINDLKEILTILSSAGIFRWLDSKWWGAKKALKSFSKSDEVVKSKDFNHIRQLTAFTEELAEFENDSKNKRLLKDHFDGLNTDIEGLTLLRDWYKKVRAKFGFSIGHRSSFADVLFGLPTQTIQGLNQLSQQGFLENLKQVDFVFSKLGENVPKFKDRNRFCILTTSEIPDAIRQIEDSLKCFIKTGVDTKETVHSLSQSVISLKKYLTEVDSVSKDSNSSRILGDHFSGVNTETEPIEDSIAFVKDTLAGNEKLDIPIKLLKKGDKKIFEVFKNIADSITTIIQDHELCYLAFSQDTHLIEEKWLGNLRTKSLDETIGRANFALGDKDSFNHWVGYLKSVRKIEEADLSPYISLVESGEINSYDLVSGFFFRAYDALSRKMLSSHKVLRDFQGYDQEQIRKKFQEYDKEIIKLCREKIAHKVDQIKVPEGSNTQKVKLKTEASLIRHEIGKKARHIHIRQLVRRSGKALQALKPCFMMGPLSVAQYLNPGELHFDILIIDEASQMRPEDAIGAIGRSKQIVIVGDPKQLPPTSFFQRMFDAEDSVESDEITGIEESESILDASLSLFKPPRRLTWHYRSRHENLIQFSNKYFYKDTLNVFPSPFRDDDEYGIKLINIPNGRFSGRKNMPEAQQIAKNVIDHMAHFQDETLGVVAMNITQKELIEDEVYSLLKKSPEAQMFDDIPKVNNESFFVKNLENVQGDERDVIFISITYGPDDNGAIHQRFGPINTNTGWRRLNVLFTRARKKIVVFSSLLAENITITPNTKLGVKALRDYLVFAERGRISDIDDPGRITHREPDSDFEIAVADALKKKGYNCEPQIGVERYFIDIGVYHPDLPGMFILGVECDGAPYHSGKSVRDRDRLRENVLTGLGWQIHRIWSTDWYQDPDSEIDRLIKRIEILRKSDRESGRSIIVEPEEKVAEPQTEDSPTPVPSQINNYVEVNDTVTFIDLNEPDEPITYQIIKGKTNLSVGLINEHTPIAQLFLESEVGEEVVLKTSTGSREFEITDLKKYGSEDH